jgi:hypothetical protein
VNGAGTSRALPPIDYTNLGFDSMRDAMLTLAHESLPEYTDLSENDLGVLLIELFAYVCDITLYYQTRIAANLLPGTSDEPDALVQLLRLIGYELRPPAPARADLRIGLAPGLPTPIDIPTGTQFFATLGSGEQLTFEAARSTRIEASDLTPPDPSSGLRFFLPLPVVEGRTVVDDPVAHSDGTPNQMYVLRSQPVIEHSVEVTVDQPGVGATRWTEVDTLAFSAPADRHFIVQRDAQGLATILFGDGSNGIVPPAGTAVSPVVIRSAYRVGGGTSGNVAANTQFTSSLPGVLTAENPQAAGGGAAAEDIERARLFAPRLFRSQERAVTLDDCIELALQVQGVGKAAATALNWNEIVLYVAPSGRVAEPSELLKRDILAFFEPSRLAGSILVVLGPDPADVYLRATVIARPYFLEADVRTAVEGAVADLLAFETVDFGEPVYLSRVYDAIQSLQQVASLTVTEFSRRPGGGVDPSGVLILAPHELARPGYRDNPETPPDPTDPTKRPPIVAAIQGAVSA